MTKERLIWVLLLSGILISAGVLYLPKPDNYMIELEKFWVKKTHGKPVYDMIIIGDSRAYRGISPAEIEKIIPGIKVLNFGYSNGRLNKFMYKEAEKRFKPDSKQKIILLAITPNALTIESVENEHYLSQLKLPKEEIIERLYFAPFLYYFSPLTPEDILFPDTAEKIQNNYVQEFFDNGWAASYKIVEDSLPALKDYKQWFEKNKVSNKLVNDMAEQIKIWTKQGIKVFALRPPTLHSMKLLEDSLSGFDQKQIKQKIEDAGAIWINTIDNNYHSYDGSHIHRDSAVKLSKKIAQIIKKNL